MKAYVIWFVVSVVGLIAIDNIVRIGGFPSWTEYAAIAFLAFGGLLGLIRSAK
jgi:hypothetical protein